MELENLLSYLVRWIHIFAGVTWIGILYYFNFVQTEFFKETDAGAKSSAISKLVPRALWWFRYGALLTFISGLALAGFLASAINFYIMIGILPAETERRIPRCSVWKTPSWRKVTGS